MRALAILALLVLAACGADSAPAGYEDRPRDALVGVGGSARIGVTGAL